jgi:hypothetical protein
VPAPFIIFPRNLYTFSSETSFPFFFFKIKALSDGLSLSLFVELSLQDSVYHFIEFAVAYKQIQVTLLRSKLLEQHSSVAAKFEINQVGESKVYISTNGQSFSICTRDFLPHIYNNLHKK